MSKKEKLLVRVRNNPNGVRFEELIRLVEAVGFVLARVEGSHSIFLHPNRSVPIVNLQRASAGDAKPYQVQQVLDIIDTHHLEVT